MSVIKNDTTKKNRLKGGFVFSSISLIHKEKIGAGERSRTLDLLITNELLYQLSYTGVSTTTHRWDAAKPAILAQVFRVLQIGNAGDCRAGGTALLSSCCGTVVVLMPGWRGRCLVR